MTTTVRAEISATVWEVAVKPGDAITAGQDMVILESMKMEIPATAPTSGTVTEVGVEPGQRVEEGDVLVVIDQ